MKRVFVLALEGVHASSITTVVDVFNETGIGWNTQNGIKAVPRFKAHVIAHHSHTAFGRRPNNIPTPRAFEQSVLKQNGGDDLCQDDLIVIPGLDLHNTKSTLPDYTDCLAQHIRRGARLAVTYRMSSNGKHAAKYSPKQAGCHGVHQSLFDHFPEFKISIPTATSTPWLIDEEPFCFGLCSSLDLSLYLVKKYCGLQTALQTAEFFLLNPNLDLLHTDSLKLTSAPHQDASISHAQAWMEQNYAQNLCKEKLANYLGMSARTFERRFKRAMGEAPLNYFQRLRIEKAKSALRGTEKSIEEISAQVGYDSTRFFREIFKKQEGVTPRAWRKQLRKAVK